MQSEVGSSVVGIGANMGWTFWPGRSAGTVVLVHGIGNNRSSWFGIPGLLVQQGWNVLAVDLRGHGASTVQPPFAAQQMAADLATLLADRSLVRPVLVGHSLGALVCSLAVAQQLPVRAVVNIDQSLKLGEFATALRSLWPALQADFHGTVAAIFDSMMPPTLPAASRALLTAQYARMSPEVTRSLWAPLVELDTVTLDAMVGQIVGGIRCPYLALHGASPGADYADWLQQRIPTAIFEQWEGTGHFPHLVDPQRFVQRVGAFASALP